MNFSFGKLLFKDEVKVKFVLVGLWNTIFGYLVFFLLDTVFEEIFTSQKKRIYNALINSSSDQVLNFDNVLKKIINE